MKKIMTLMIVCGLFAGCVDAIPDPEDVYGGDEINKDWETISGEFTLMLENNTTLVYADEMWLDTNTTHGLIDLHSFNYTAKHMSYVVDNNTVSFTNRTYHMNGVLEQDGYVWSKGLAPELGNATIHFAAFPFNVTIEYEITYRIWDGLE
jgi:hypothetical protein